MLFRAAVEDIEANHHVCWVFDLPGCFSSARTPDEAIARAPARIADYFAWIAGHEPAVPIPPDPIEADVVEIFEGYTSSEDPDYLVNAFFEDDGRPLSCRDVAMGLRLLEWLRRDLLAVVERLAPERLHERIRHEVRGSIAGILEHVAGAENWYLDQLNASIDWPSLPEGVFGKLEGVRGNTRSQLPKLIGEERITEHCGERWSARKVLRRTLWHERAHTEQIARLLAGGA